MSSGEIDASKLAEDHDEKLLQELHSKTKGLEIRQKS